jgi:hypothetical protein
MRCAARRSDPAAILARRHPARVHRQNAEAFRIQHLGELSSGSGAAVRDPDAV